MKNGVVPIEIFNVLDKIRERNKIKDGEWAKNIDSEKLYPQSRISELRRVNNLTLLGESTTDTVGRAFSVQKCLLLTRSLMKIVGERVVRKELLKVLETVKDKKERMMLLILLLPEKTEDQILLYLESVVNSLE